MFKVYFVVLTTITFMKNEVSAEDNTGLYLGAKTTKPYFFPWLVTFHRYTPTKKEFIGSGSIMTPKYVLSSMDCFSRWSKSRPRPAYMDIGDWEVHSGGIWANPYERSDVPDNVPWLQIRKVSGVYMIKNDGEEHYTFAKFSAQDAPRELNKFEMSPFGFRLSLILVKVVRVPGQDRDEWEWRRATLPMPLFAEWSHLSVVRKSVFMHHTKKKLEDGFAELERDPTSNICQVGGWRKSDWRLVEYDVVYVPFEQCREIYCAFDSRACLTWPVQGKHVCFRSVTFNDLCWRDQGSALYCKHIFDSAAAILTSSPTCGHAGLPGVYTTIHWGFLLMGQVSYKDAVYPAIDRNKYTPPPPKDLFPAYTY